MQFIGYLPKGWRVFLLSNLRVVLLSAWCWVSRFLAGPSCSNPLISSSPGLWPLTFTDINWKCVLHVPQVESGLLFNTSVVGEHRDCQTHSGQGRKIACFVDIQSLMHILFFLYSSFKIWKLFACGLYKTRLVNAVVFLHENIPFQIHLWRIV